MWPWFEPGCSRSYGNLADHSTAHKFIHFFSFCSKLGEPEDRGDWRELFDHDDVELDEATLARRDQRWSAKTLTSWRSLITNVGLLGFFTVLLCVIALLPTAHRAVYSAIVSSIFKGAFPVLTAVANFGTVRVVAAQSWNYFKSKTRLPRLRGWADQGVGEFWTA